MEEASKTKSIYIHIPFCSNICSYCDFCKFYYNEKIVNFYLESLELEIKNNYQNEEIETIYIGGGTPSSLSISELTKLFNTLKIINVSSNLEFTFECNVMDITIEKLEFLKKKGVNRLSVGIQSFQSEILKFLEREYNKEDIIYRINLAKKYFDNINIDLMYAIPGEDLNILKCDIEEFLLLDVNHISTYSLIIEEHTKLSINNTSYIDEDLDYKMYELINDTLVNNGYIHYEVSNFSKEGYQSKHNLTYWKNKKYYGFGLGASGYIDNIRYTNTKNLNKYLSGNFCSEEEIITDYLLASNYAVLGFRTIYGVNKKEFKNKFGKSLIDYFNVSKLVEDNIILENDECYYIDYKYWYVLNEILVNFI